MCTPIIFQPLMFKKQIGTGPLRRILVEALGQKVLEQRRAAFRQWWHIVLYDTEHDYQVVLAGRNQKRNKHTRHAVRNLGVWWPSSQKLNDGTSQRPDIRLR